jgi:hypothetical protein
VKNRKILENTASEFRKISAARQLARKIAAITLALWKKGGSFDAEHLKPQAA